MRRIFKVLILITIAFSSPDPEGAFIGIGHSSNEKPKGLLITNVVKGSPAKIAGLVEGDIITEINGSSVTNSSELSAIISKNKPGSKLRFTISRNSKTLTLPLIIGIRKDYESSLRKGERKLVFPVSPDIISTDYSGIVEIVKVQSTLEKAKLTAGYDKLKTAFETETQSYKGHYLLDAVALPLLDPVAVYYSGTWIKEKLNTAEGDVFNFFLNAPIVMDEHNGERQLSKRIAPLKKRIPPSSIDLDAVVSIVRESNNHINDAFTEISEEELSKLSQIAPFMLEYFTKSIYINTDPDSQMAEAYEELIDITKKIKYDALYSSGLALSSLCHPDISKQLSQIKEGEGADSTKDILIDKMVVVAEKDSSGKKIQVLGRLLVTGTKAMTYSEEAAIWIDLGGDDTYQGFSGGTPYKIFNNYNQSFNEGRTGLHIDLGGNDTYIRNTAGSIGSGFCGSGCLIDLDGNDLYSGSRLTQGSSFCGTGILYDAKGNDTYLSQEEAQGFSIFGIGLLFDGSGNDYYNGARYVQGVGITKGLGCLIDAGGNDRYIASYKSPNGYGNIGTWESFSQGAGIGLRSIADGGIGIIADRSGNDYYEAGNFSQACGYFFGFGLFHDYDGNDVVIGNRYTQGAGAHQAAALFCDDRGDDSYTGYEAMNQGGAWDIQTSWFIDRQGNDTYSGASYSQGGTAQGAFAVFMDTEGDDTYISGSISNGDGGAQDYHPDYDTKNISVFIDSGKGKDNYSKTHGKRKNNQLLITDDDKNPLTGYGVFLDE